MDDWLRKSHTWPVAPVDLRYDRKRGLWVAPPPFRFMYGITQSSITSTGQCPFTADISDTFGIYVKLITPDLNGASNASADDYPTKLYDSRGSGMNLDVNSASDTAPIVFAYSVTDLYMPSGSRVMLYYDTLYNEYIIIQNPSYPVNLFGSASGFELGVATPGIQRVANLSFNKSQFFMESGIPDINLSPACSGQSATISLTNSIYPTSINYITGVQQTTCGLTFLFATAIVLASGNNPIFGAGSQTFTVPSGCHIDTDVVCDITNDIDGITVYKKTISVFDAGDCA